MKPEVKVWWQTALVTLGAIGLFTGMRALPIAASDLHYTDFHADGRSFLEFCEPGTPQFAQVERVRSPVTLALRPRSQPVAGEPVEVEVELVTLGGKRIVERDLMVVHTERLHLLIVGPTLDDYHHVHPQVLERDGLFVFSFTPHRDGDYRVFADFMPRATGRSLYAGGDIAVAPSGAPSEHEGPPTEPNHYSVVDDFQFSLGVPSTGVRINRLASITMSVRRTDGGPLFLDEVMGATAHLVAFDAERTGFAHIHPVEREVASGEEDGNLEQRDLDFSVLLNDPGTYRLWAQVKIDGHERFAPFDLVVRP